MSHALTVTLATRNQNLPENCVPALHAVFFQWLERGDAVIAQRVHDDAGPKPYTVSSLICDADQTARFRITLLDDSIVPVFRTGLEQMHSIRIAGTTLEFADLPRVTHHSYA